MYVVVHWCSHNRHSTKKKKVDTVVVSVGVNIPLWAGRTGKVELVRYDISFLNILTDKSNLIIKVKVYVLFHTTIKCKI